MALFTFLRIDILGTTPLRRGDRPYKINEFKKKLACNIPTTVQCIFLLNVFIDFQWLQYSVQQVLMKWVYNPTIAVSEYKFDGVQ